MQERLERVKVLTPREMPILGKKTRRRKRLAGPSPSPRLQTRIGEIRPREDRNRAKPPEPRVPSPMPPIAREALVHARLKREPGAAKLLELEPVSAEEARRICWGREKCTIVRPDGTIVFVGRDLRDASCSEVIIEGGARLKCPDQVKLEMWRNRLLSLARGLAHKISAGSPDRFYGFPLRRLAEHLISLLEEERRRLGPGRRSTGERLEALARRFEERLREAAEILETVHPIVDEARYRGELELGLVSPSCPSYGLYYKRADGGFVFCKRFFCFDREGRPRAWEKCLGPAPLERREEMVEKARRIPAPF